MIRKTNYQRWTWKPSPRLVHASIARGIIFKSPFFIFFCISNMIFLMILKN